MVLIILFLFPKAHNNSTASLNSQRSISKTNNSHYDSIAGGNASAAGAAANQNSSMTTGSGNGGPGAGLYENGSSVMRKSPEGKDNDDAYRGENNVKALSKDSSLMQQQQQQSHKYHETTNKLNDHHHNHHQQQQPQQPHQRIGNDISTEIFSASNDNGKINVQVTVLVGEFFLSFPFSSVSRDDFFSRL